MPRVSAAHEQAVRGRIVESALRVFAEKGYHGATIGDVVRDSGLSVGAIYTYFSGKDELFLATCDLSSGEGLGELGNRLVRGGTVAEKLAIAVGFFLDSMVGAPGRAGHGRHAGDAVGAGRRRARDPRLPVAPARPDRRGRRTARSRGRRPWRAARLGRRRGPGVGVRHVPRRPAAVAARAGGRLPPRGRRTARARAPSPDPRFGRGARGARRTRAFRPGPGPSPTPSASPGSRRSDPPGASPAATISACRTS